MGTTKIADNPHLPMAEDKATKLKNIFKKPFQALFQKDKKNKDVKKEKEPHPEPIKVTPVADLLKNLEKLEIKEESNQPKHSPVDGLLKNLEDLEINEEDEFKNFTIKVIEDDNKDETRATRIDSQSSDDSGFADKCPEPDSEDEKEDKRKKKVQVVVLSRGPIRNDFGEYRAAAHPYANANDACRQINQINKQTFSGGQVIENKNRVENYSEIDLALKQVELNVQNFAQITQQEQSDRWQLAQEFVGNTTSNVDDFLSDMQSPDEFCEPELDCSTEKCLTNFDTELDPIEEFSTTDHTYQFDSLAVPLSYDDADKSFIFPTPPHSENVPSPMSDSQASFYPNNQDYTLSPETSSSIHISDYEKYQEIMPFEEFPTCVTDYEVDKPKRERLRSSSMTMKQYKDLQKEISAGFSKKECCQIDRKPCRKILQDHMEKLKTEDRRNLCLRVAALDVKNAFGVLMSMLKEVAKGSPDEDLLLAHLGLICEKLLAQRPSIFVDDYGLSLIKFSTLCLYSKPLVTRYLVHCARTVLRTEAYKPTTEYVFNEVDAQGDTLVLACSRAGDKYADVLAELVRTESADIPLFNVHHVNNEGYTALHAACKFHSEKEPKLHTLHILLEHAGADIWRGDIKGGDTPLHLAVNTANCDLHLIMIMFRHVDRKQWKKLAHAQNRSSISVLEYARTAIRSSAKQSYPPEVLEFLKKCR